MTLWPFYLDLGLGTVQEDGDPATRGRVESVTPLPENAIVDSKTGRLCLFVPFSSSDTYVLRFVYISHAPSCQSETSSGLKQSYVFVVQ